MKKLITSLSLIICLNTVAQPTGTVVLYSVFPYNICKGMDLTISFKYLGPHDSTKYFSFFYQAQNLALYGIMQNIHCTVFYPMIKNVINGDTIYTFNHTVPVSMPNGQYGVKVMPDHNWPGKNVNIMFCDFTGIEELEESNVKPVYYDLRGNIIDPRKNELIIKKVGNKRYKTIITE